MNRTTMIDVVIEKQRLSRVLDILTALVDEAVFAFDTNELLVTVVDPATVGLADLTLDENDFESYSATQHAIGLNLTRLNNIIGIAENNDTLVSLSYDETVHKLRIEVDDLDYTMAVIDPDTIDTSDIPNVDYDAHFSLSTSALSHAISAADMVSETIRFGVDEDGDVYLDAEGDTDDMTYTPTEDEIEYPENFTATDIISEFSLDYLKDMSGVFGSDEYLDISLGDELPVEMSFSAATNGNGRYMLAPRIDST